VLKRFGMEDCKPIGTPLDTKVKFVKLSNEEYDANAPRMGSVPYKSAVGSLWAQWLIWPLPLAR
jgi:hypothetical protein